MSRLQHERERRGWTQTDLAYRARLTQSEVSGMERGRLIVGEKRAARLVRLLGVPLGQLLADVGRGDGESIPA